MTNRLDVAKVVRGTIRTILESILTPNTAFDLISDIRSRPKLSTPYIISIFGVNGVGKSTSLAKLSFYILQHNLRVMVVAGDTFRSGAVEQLKAHVRNLKSIEMDNGSGIELYEGGKMEPCISREYYANPILNHKVMGKTPA